MRELATQDWRFANDGIKGAFLGAGVGEDSRWIIAPASKDTLVEEYLGVHFPI